LSPSSRSRLSGLLAAVVLCTVAGDASVLAARQARPEFPLSVALERNLTTQSAKTAAKYTTERDAALKRLFERRAEAVLKRDRKAFLAVVDPKAKDFAAKQGVVFDNLRQLDFAAWSYEASGDSYSPGSIPFAGYGADDVWLPVEVLRYQLKGFDKAAIARRVVYTAVQRGKRWYLANDADLEAGTSSGTSVRIDPWENGPIVVERSAHGIVIGHPKDADAVTGIVREVESAVKHVSSFVGRSWGERVVIVLPGDNAELQHVLENPSVPFEFAAVARPEFTTLRDDFTGRFAGARVVINPGNFEANAAANRMLIRHEMTHVATFHRTGPLSPKWLIEGLAEYVGNAGSTFSTQRLGGELGDLIDSEGVPTTLPGDSDFGITADAGVGYNSSWLLCRYIASKYGRAALLRLYDAVGTRTGLDTPGTKLATALRTVLHTDEAALLKGWRPYARAAVADLAKLLAAPGKPYREDDKGEIDAADLAGQKDLDEKALTRLGLERGAEGFWYVGNVDRPDKLVVEMLVVADDEASAAALEGVLAGRYRPYDPSGGVAVPHGRMYFVGTAIKGVHYNQTVAVVRVGILVAEVRVLAPGFADPSGETRALAARQYAIAAA
jgi:hypothetical protein